MSIIFIIYYFKVLKILFYLLLLYNLNQYNFNTVLYNYMMLIIKI